jgi:hypothetical protein
MPWRRKPAHFLRYLAGPVREETTLLVYCLGAQGYRCHHSARLKAADLPDWDMSDVSAHLKCTACGAVGWVDVRPEHREPMMGTNANFG